VVNSSQNIPVPDPSSLTTEQLRRELAGLRDSLETRLNGMDKANVLLNQQFLQHPSDIEKAILQLKELHNEKFDGIKTQFIDQGTVFTNRIDSLRDGIQKQFDERDVRATASESASNTAVNAALSAQKEAASAQNEANAAAITKSEAATVKQIDGILALLASNTKAIDEKIASINGRLDRGEGTKSGASATITTIIAVAAVATAIIGGIVSFNHVPVPTPVYQTNPAVIGH
jgi:hypothetical protein